MNHILVVDDEAEIRSSLEEILREEGYGVASAATAAEALVLLEDSPYDVVLLDIWLPDRDGLDVLADICFAFITDPHPSRSVYPAIEQLLDVAGLVLAQGQGLGPGRVGRHVGH